MKLRVFLRGREMANPEWGIEVLNKVWPRLSDIGNLEQPPKKDGRYINMYVDST